MNFKIFTAAILLTTGVTTQTQAQEENSKSPIVAGADIVSSYEWRGSYNAGASVQPTLAYKFCNFTVGAWGSTDFEKDGHKEVDLSLNYSIKGFTIGVTDYWWDGEKAHNYLHYTGDDASHRWEGNIAYQLPCKKFPLIASVNTMFAGNDYNSDGDRAYSTYIELNYPFAIGSIDMNAIVGATPWASPSILSGDCTGFSVCNIALNATKKIQLTDNFALPVFTKIILNPAIEDVYITFGVSLYLD